MHDESTAHSRQPSDVSFTAGLPAVQEGSNVCSLTSSEGDETMAAGAGLEIRLKHNLLPTQQAMPPAVLSMPQTDRTTGVDHRANLFAF